MPNNDYKKLYNAQNFILYLIKQLDTPFYLTGGTALSRFFLNHRYSFDLDFFLNGDDRFAEYIALISQELKAKAGIDYEKSLTGQEFARLVVSTEPPLKVELVNDVKFRSGLPFRTSFGWVDNVRNILSNKLGALVSREEAKDICDIYFIAKSYHFNWAEVIGETKRKMAINELDVAQKINQFPLELLDHISWIVTKPDASEFREKLTRLSDDIFLGKDNSLGKQKIDISTTKPSYEI